VRQQHGEEEIKPNLWGRKDKLLLSPPFPLSPSQKPPSAIPSKSGIILSRCSSDPTGFGRRMADPLTSSKWKLRTLWCPQPVLFGNSVFSGVPSLIERVVEIRFHSDGAVAVGAGKGEAEKSFSLEFRVVDIDASNQ